MQTNQNKVLIAFIVLTVLFGGFYYVGQQEVEDAVEQLSLELSDFSVDRLSLIPSEADLTLIYDVSNPNDIPLMISMDGAIYYGETMITPFTVEERMIPAMGSGTVDAQITLNGTLMETIGNPQNHGNYSLNGTLTARGKYMGILPVTVTLEMAELKAKP